MATTTDPDRRLTAVLDQARRDFPHLSVRALDAYDPVDQPAWATDADFDVQVAGTLVLPSTGPGHYAVDVVYSTDWPLPGPVDVPFDHAVNIFVQNTGARPYVFVNIGMRSAATPARYPRSELSCSKLHDPRLVLSFVHVNDMPMDGEPLGTFRSLADVVADVERRETASIASAGFPGPAGQPGRAPEPVRPHDPTGHDQPLGR